jgi:hypothetical protein
VAGEPLQLAIVNQVFFHLEVVAGAMHVLRDFSSAPLTVYLHEKVMNTDWYGFKSWMGTQQGVVWKDCKDYDGKKQYDVVWFVSPEYHLPWVAARVAEMKPKVALQMVHNGHIKDEDMQKVLKLTSGSTVYTLAPHVAKYITNRTKAPTEWILPIFPYTPANVCALADLQVGVLVVGQQHQRQGGLLVVGPSQTSRGQQPGAVCLQVCPVTPAGQEHKKSGLFACSRQPLGSSEGPTEGASASKFPSGAATSCPMLTCSICLTPLLTPRPNTRSLLQAGRQCLKGFSVQGRIEKSRRNYTAMWEQMTDYRKQHGNLAVSNFRLNILGESVEAFNVPGAWSLL